VLLKAMSFFYIKRKNRERTHGFTKTLDKTKTAIFEAKENSSQTKSLGIVTLPKRGVQFEEPLFEPAGLRYQTQKRTLEVRGTLRTAAKTKQTPRGLGAGKKPGNQWGRVEMVSKGRSWRGSPRNNSNEIRQPASRKQTQTVIQIKSSNKSHSHPRYP